MKLPSNKETAATAGHFHHPESLPVLGMGPIYLSCWPRGSHESPKQLKLWPRLLLTLQKDGKALLLKTTRTQLTEHLPRGFTPMN